MTKLDDRVTEWEAGLPGPDELTPLSQMLITPELACAFSISPEPSRTPVDVNRASQSTVSELRRLNSAPAGLLKGFQSFSSQENGGQAGVNGDGAALARQGNQAAGGEGEAGDGGEGEAGDGGDGNFKKGRKQGERETEEADSASFGFENSAEEQSARTLKRPRLVWTPQLHKRFVDVVAHLGIKNAVPKTIMQLMNVEGLTRENVASHLQKYRLYLKRMQGLSSEGPSPSDQLFASTPVPHNLAASSFLGNHRDDSMPLHMPMPMPFASPVVPMHPVVGIAHPHGHGHMPVPMNAPAAYAGFDPHAYGTVFARMPPQRMPSGDQRELLGDMADSSTSYPHVVPRE